MKKLLLLCCLVGWGIVCCAQSPELPGLRRVLAHPRDSIQYVDALNRLAMLLYEKSADSTFYYARMARETANRLDYAQGKADALNNLGIVFDIKGDLQLALRYYEQAHEAYRKLDDSVNIVQAIMNIALVYQELGKENRALEEFDAAFKLGQTLRRDSILALVIYNYAEQYPTRISREAMGKYIRQATDIATRYHDVRTLIAINQLLADDMISHGNRQQGLLLLAQTIDTALSKKLFYVSMDMLTDLADNLANNNQPAEAASFYQKGLTIAQKNDYLIYSQIMARKLFDFYSKTGDSTKASGYSRLLLQLNDKRDKLYNQSTIDYLDYALKDQQIRSLEVRSHYQTALLSLAVIAVLLAAVVIIVIRQNLKRLKSLNRQIFNQNSQMRKTLDALEQSQEENSKMMQIVAHDLRNPLGSIYSITLMMLEKDGLSEEDNEMLTLIQRSSQNSLELVSGLLSANAQSEELKKEPVDIGELLQYCVSLSADKAAAKGQRIELNARPLNISASPAKLWRVISNLINNAIKFSPSDALIRVSMEKHDHDVLISIKDQGIGIPADMQDKVFDLSTAAKRTGTAGEQSFGLGLAISKQIVEAHGGKIWFESRPLKGTAFFVDLPVG